MKICIINNTPIPVVEYGGTERVIWWLGKELTKRGHKICYLVPKGSSSSFSEVLFYDDSRSLNEQIPDDVDLVHIHFQTNENLKKPYLITHHGNFHPEKEFNINTVFCSKNHAQRNSSSRFVHNCVDPDDYGPVDFDKKRKYLLFSWICQTARKKISKTANILPEKQIMS